MPCRGLTPVLPPSAGLAYRPIHLKVQLSADRLKDSLPALVSALGEIR